MMDWKNKRLQPGQSGIVRARQFLPMSRRRFLGLSAATAGVGLAGGFSPRKALAATEVAYMGWLGYDEAANVGGFLDQNRTLSCRRPTWNRRNSGRRQFRAAGAATWTSARRSASTSRMQRARDGWSRST